MVAKLSPTDYVGFTFFVGCMAMMAASAFSFLSLSQFDKMAYFSVGFRFDYFYCRSTLFLHERLLGKFGESPTFSVMLTGY
jgi:hypothetical protein